MGMY